MYTVLLSGGSGKRLWPLSNALRSKQYIKLLRDQRAGGLCSMIQRVWGAADRSGACRKQRHLRQPRAGGDHPQPAKGCGDRRGAHAAGHVSGGGAVLCLPEGQNGRFGRGRGVRAAGGPLHRGRIFPRRSKRCRRPCALRARRWRYWASSPPSHPASTATSSPGADMGTYIQVDSFQEKPDEALAERLIENGALWNCGVFCLRIGDVLKRLKRYGAPSGYDGPLRALRKAAPDQLRLRGAGKGGKAGRGGL